MADTIQPLHFLNHKWLRSFENYTWVRITINNRRISIYGSRRNEVCVTAKCLHISDTELDKSK